MTDPYAPQSQVPQGYLPPSAVYRQVPGDADDPLVNPVYSGINGWFQRIGGLFTRSWKLMGAIFAITTVLPSLLISIAGTVAAVVVTLQLVETDSRRVSEEMLAAGLPVFLLAVLAVVVVSYLLQMAGYAGATYAVTKQAAGHQVGLGEALGYGFRRCLGLFGWQFVVFLIAVGGLLACILPVFYVIAALALVGPIYLFERGNPIGRSFSIFNNNLGRVLGRLALLLLASLLVSGFTSVFDRVGQTVVGQSTTDLKIIMGAAGLSAALSVIFQLPLTMLTFSGILLTYTEQRGYEGPVTAQSLADELETPRGRDFSPRGPESQWSEQ